MAPRLARTISKRKVEAIEEAIDSSASPSESEAAMEPEQLPVPLTQRNLRKTAQQSSDSFAHFGKGEDKGYHTDPQEDGVDDATMRMPFLPPELLNPTTSASQAPTQRTPWEQATVAQRKRWRKKRAMFDRKREAKVMAKLAKAAEGTLVLEAGRAAQARRGIKPARHVVKVGRVEKKRRRQVGGRAQLIETRKREISRTQSSAPVQSTKTKNG